MNYVLAMSAGFAFSLLQVTIANAESSGPSLIPQERCNASYPTLAKNTTKQEIAAIQEMVVSDVMTDVLRYVLGRDSLVADYVEGLEETAFSTLLRDSRKQSLTDEQKAYWNAWIDYRETQQGASRKKFYDKSYANRNSVRDFTSCSFQAMYFDPSPGLGMLKEMSMGIPRTGRFGYFRTAINTCTVAKSVGTGSQYLEPERWQGSQFVVLDVSFKNEDTEGRLPFEGALVIKQPDGKKLRYDSSETIMAEGYGIGFKSVNPFITMPTKLVFRIPDDITGEVLWEPGRNPDGKKLWCTFLNNGSPVRSKAR